MDCCAARGASLSATVTAHSAGTGAALAAAIHAEPNSAASNGVLRGMEQKNSPAQCMLWASVGYYNVLHRPLRPRRCDHWHSIMNKPHSYTYRDAGVDIDAGDALVERIKPLVRRTTRPEVLAGIGGFSAMVELPLGRYRRPVLVSGTDGVGTKLKLAIETNTHAPTGIDLVAMCVNDVVVQGAEPLFFLDYYATGRLDVEIAAR